MIYSNDVVRCQMFQPTTRGFLCGAFLEHCSCFPAWFTFKKYDNDQLKQVLKNRSHQCLVFTGPETWGSFYHLPGPSWLWRLAIGALLRSGTLQGNLGLQVKEHQPGSTRNINQDQCHVSLPYFVGGAGLMWSKVCWQMWHLLLIVFVGPVGDYVRWCCQRKGRRLRLRGSLRNCTFIFQVHKSVFRCFPPKICKLRPNGVRHFNVAIDLCEKRGHWRFAVEVFEEISWRNLQRSVVSVGSVICVLQQSPSLGSEKSRWGWTGWLKLKEQRHTKNT